MKDAVLFSPKDKEKLIDLLQMDTYEPPMTQVNYGLITGHFTGFSVNFGAIVNGHFRQRVGSVYPN